MSSPSGEGDGAELASGGAACSGRLGDTFELAGGAGGDADAGRVFSGGAGADDDSGGFDGGGTVVAPAAAAAAAAVDSGRISVAAAGGAPAGDDGTGHDGGSFRADAVDVTAAVSSAGGAAGAAADASDADENVCSPQYTVGESDVAAGAADAARFGRHGGSLRGGAFGDTSAVRADDNVCIGDGGLDAGDLGATAAAAAAAAAAVGTNTVSGGLFSGDAGGDDDHGGRFDGGDTGGAAAAAAATAAAAAADSGRISVTATGGATAGNDGTGHDGGSFHTAAVIGAGGPAGAVADASDADDDVIMCDSGHLTAGDAGYAAAAAAGAGASGAASAFLQLAPGESIVSAGHFSTLIRRRGARLCLEDHDSTGPLMQKSLFKTSWLPTCREFIETLMGESSKDMHTDGPDAFVEDCLELIEIPDGTLLDVPVLLAESPVEQAERTTFRQFYRLKRTIDVNSRGWRFAEKLGLDEGVQAKVRSAMKRRKNAHLPEELLTGPDCGDLLRLLRAHASDLCGARNMATMRIDVPGHPCDQSLGAFLPAGATVPPVGESMLLWPPYGGVMLGLARAEEEKTRRVQAIAAAVEPATAAAHALEKASRARSRAKALGKPPPAAPLLGVSVTPAPGREGAVLISPSVGSVGGAGGAMLSPPASGRGAGQLRASAAAAAAATAADEDVEIDPATAGITGGAGNVAPAARLVDTKVLLAGYDAGTVANAYDFGFNLPPSYLSTRAATDGSNSGSGGCAPEAWTISGYSLQSTAHKCNEPAFIEGRNGMAVMNCEYKSVLLGGVWPLIVGRFTTPWDVHCCTPEQSGQPPRAGEETLDSAAASSFTSEPSLPSAMPASQPTPSSSSSSASRGARYLSAPTHGEGAHLTLATPLEVLVCYNGPDSDGDYDTSEFLIKQLDNNEISRSLAARAMNALLKAADFAAGEGGGPAGGQGAAAATVASPGETRSPRPSPAGPKKGRERHTSTPQRSPSSGGGGSGLAKRKSRLSATEAAGSEPLHELPPQRRKRQKVAAPAADSGSPSQPLDSSPASGDGPRALASDDDDAGSDAELAAAACDAPSVARNSGDGDDWQRTATPQLDEERATDDWHELAEERAAAPVGALAHGSSLAQLLARAPPPQCYHAQVLRTRAAAAASSAAVAVDTGAMVAVLESVCAKLRTAVEDTWTAGLPSPPTPPPRRLKGGGDGCAGASDSCMLHGMGPVLAVVWDSTSQRCWYGGAVADEGGGHSLVFAPACTFAGFVPSGRNDEHVDAGFLAALARRHRDRDAEAPVVLGFPVALPRHQGVVTWATVDAALGKGQMDAVRKAAAAQATDSAAGAGADSPREDLGGSAAGAARRARGGRGRGYKRGR